jgi:hypothetical protein
MHIAKNFLIDAGAFDAALSCPLILGIWGGKGQVRGGEGAGWGNSCWATPRGAGGAAVEGSVPHARPLLPLPTCRARASKPSSASRSWGEAGERPVDRYRPALKRGSSAPASAALRCDLPAACPARKVGYVWAPPLSPPQPPTHSVEPIIMSAGELEHEWAGTPAKLIRDRYRCGRRDGGAGAGAGGLPLLLCPHLPVRPSSHVTRFPYAACPRRAAEVSKVHGKLSCLMINDLDAGIGHFENTQVGACQRGRCVGGGRRSGGAWRRRRSGGHRAESLRS